MTRMHGLVGIVGTGVAIAFSGLSAPVAGSGQRASRIAEWRNLLEPPASRTERLPVEWEVKPVPKGFSAEVAGAGFAGGNVRFSETPDELVRESAIVVVGVAIGNDGSFYPPGSNLQATTYYLRVVGYLKDATGRRASFLKVLADGGFLDGGQRFPGVPLPYLVEGQQYLLYLKPNRGLPWGSYGTTDHPIGKGDEYWVSGRGNGRWWEEKGQLVGSVDPPMHWNLPYRKGFPDPYPDYLPFAQGIQRAYEAVERARRGLPPLPKRKRAGE